MYIQYIEPKLTANKLKKLEQINLILKEYSAQGYVLTLRQLYYQLVARGIIPNKQPEYVKLSILLKDGRMMGLVDWDAIEDRLRRPREVYTCTDIQDAIEDTIYSYRLDRTDGQGDYIEVWCEKDALSNVLYRTTSKYGVPLMVNRGYSSCTAMHDAAERIQEALNDKYRAHILYFGDHDPSGLDMIRDIRDRLNEFGVNNVYIKHLGITLEQINDLSPPPNPTKISDPRAGWYIEQFGRTSWEVDALPPAMLEELITQNIESRFDMLLYQSILLQEQKDKDKLRKI